MTKLTEQEIRRRMAEILREQMERPALRPLPHLEGGEKDQLGSTPESHQRNPRPKRKTDIELDIFA